MLGLQILALVFGLITAILSAYCTGKNRPYTGALFLVISLVFFSISVWVRMAIVN